VGVFDEGVAAWRDQVGSLRDHVRQELVARQLADALHHVGGTGASLRVLDVGCGQGTQAIRLGRAGHDVVGIDVAEDLLRDASSALLAEPPAVQDRVRFHVGDLEDLPGEHRGHFDVVCCHGVVMYLDSLPAAVARLAATLRLGGLVSVLSRNRAGIAMRAAMTGDWSGALEGFDARTYANRLGLAEVRADDPAEVSAALEGAGLRVVDWYGVRLFTDHWGAQEVPDDVEPIVAAEYEAGRRDPYRRLAALTHTLAVLDR
jgi:SAM-dependent methyltransferase